MIKMKKLVFTLVSVLAVLPHITSAETSKEPPKAKSAAHESEQSSIKAVENGLRQTVIIKGEKPGHMNILDRMKHYDVPGVSIAVINNGQLAWAKGFGTLTNKPDSKPVDTHTLFQAASVSKSLTAVGALLLVQQGRLSLDEDANVYLKSWKIPENKFTINNKVTLRRLLSVLSHLLSEAEKFTKRPNF